MPTLTTQLQTLAHAFAEQVVEAIRSSSLQELVSGGARTVGNGRTRGGGGQPDPLSVQTRPSRRRGRLPRRSAEEIAKTLDKIILLVKTQKNGLRAEEIRTKLGMQAKEMPRILKEGLSKRKLVSKGQKRATTYFVK
jgi:hypothetical protein